MINVLLEPFGGIIFLFPLPSSVCHKIICPKKNKHKKKQNGLMTYDVFNEKEILQESRSRNIV